MKFFTHMLIHFLLATIACYAVYFLFRDPRAVVICFAAAILCDLDHIFEFWAAYGFTLNPIKFWKVTLSKRNYFKETGKVHLFFHGWEYIIIVMIAGAVTSKYNLAVSFSLGYGLHLLWDQVNFGKHALSYSLLFRLQQDFDLEKIIQKKI